MEFKICARCKLSKPRKKFIPSKQTKDGCYCYCRRCAVVVQQDYRKRNPEKCKIAARKMWLKRLYGLTPQSYEDMLEAQDRRCAICGGRGKLTRKDERFLLHIDHDHSTGKIRGLLCHNCNTILGNAGDSVAVLWKAAAYLEYHRPEKTKQH